MINNLQLEEIMDNGGGSTHYANLTMYLSHDEGTILVELEVEHTFDEGQMSSDFNFLVIQSLDERDNPIEKTFQDKEVEKFVQSDLAIDAWLEDRAKELIEDARSYYQYEGQELEIDLSGL